MFAAIAVVAVFLVSGVWSAPTKHADAGVSDADRGVAAWAVGLGAVGAVSRTCFVLVAPADHSVFLEFVHRGAVWGTGPVVAGGGVVVRRFPENGAAAADPVDRGQGDPTVRVDVGRPAGSIGVAGTGDGVLLWRGSAGPRGGAVIEGTVLNCDVAAGRCSSMFEPDFVAGIGGAYPGTRFTAAVHDRRTGCVYGLNPGLAMTTASVVKAQILAGVLLAAQDQGRSLTDSEAEDVALMMHYSHNTPPASRLYVAIGGAEGMEAIDERFEIVGTSHTARYGATVSTAEDRTVLVKRLLAGGGPLDAAAVRAAWDIMAGVSTAQSWGVTAGLPAGYEAALKNGFFPSRGAGWRVGTTGVVRDPLGGIYAITVLTDGNPNESAGIALVETVTRHINAALTAGRPAVRPVDLVRCVEDPGGWSWEMAAAALGGVDPAALRRLNGGEEVPLAGQRICRP